MEIEKICPQCDKTFESEPWHHQKYCSIQCGVDAHKGRTLITKTCLQCKKIFKIEPWRHQKFCSVMCGINFHRGETRTKKNKCSNKTAKYRPERKLIDGRRISLHRYLMEQKLNRQLKSFESVHHVDMNCQNNIIENLYLYKNESEHMKGHHSIRKIISSLLKKEIITFKNGKYEMIEANK